MQMRAQDIIRAVLDILDSDNKPTPDETCEPDTSRFKQIMAILDSDSTGPYSNTPNEVVTDVDSVTTLAGGGLKDPADIRVKDPGA
jgi:hypothetical protein|tara:strand:+ start:790 stop:1047 length:258 start_codon:yes stop_codon:yes gene_type:complete